MEVLMIGRRALSVIGLLDLAASPLLAVDVNEAPGDPTHALHLKCIGRDSISAYSGNLKISIPIGPVWEPPGCPGG
jgi:hypothetical protein